MIFLIKVIDSDFDIYIVKISRCFHFKKINDNCLNKNCEQKNNNKHMKKSTLITHFENKVHLRKNYIVKINRDKLKLPRFNIWLTKKEK